MDTVWYIGLAVAITFFAVAESYALIYPQRQDTLSRAIYRITVAHPVSVYIMGVFTGGLAVHLLTR